MKHVWFGLVGALLTTTAYGADMPMKARPAPVAPIFNWSGFYLGGHIGYGWARDDTTNINGTTPFPPGTENTVDLDGLIGGVQLGLNYQFAPNWLIGAEGDFSWSGIDGTSAGFSTVAPFTTTRYLTVNEKVKWTATATARLGYAMNDWLFYAKGGAAWARFDVDSNTTNPVAGTVVALVSGGETRSGWTVGGGVEWSFLKNWSAKLEYDYLDFGTVTVSRTPTFSLGAVPNPLLRDASAHIHMVKFGINYRFDWPGGG